MASLTHRERKVQVRMAEHRSHQAIGERLSLRKKTVESHVRSMFGKLCLPASAADGRRALAVVRYLEADCCQAGTHGVH
jgi:DNA-binding NarL/FixJ family response regulator